MTRKEQDHVDILVGFSDQVKIISQDKYDSVSKNGFTIDINQNKMVVKNRFPREEVYRILLLDIRSIIMNTSPFYFDKVCDYLIKNDFRVNDVKKYKQIFKDIFNSEVVGLKLNTEQLTTRKVFNIILNEENFHQEVGKKGMNKIKSHPVMESMSRFNFFHTLDDLRRLFIIFNKEIVEGYKKNLQK